MLYQGYFSNIDNKKYGVEIKTGTSTTPIEITLGGDDPVIITTSSEGLFSPIKSRSCTIDIYSTEYYLDLYEPTSRGTRVRIFEYEENTSLYPGHIGKVIFFGYSAPACRVQTCFPAQRACR